MHTSATHYAGTKKVHLRRNHSDGLHYPYNLLEVLGGREAQVVDARGHGTVLRVGEELQADTQRQRWKWH